MALSVVSTTSVFDMYSYFFPLAVTSASASHSKRYPHVLIKVSSLHDKLMTEALSKMLIVPTSSLRARVSFNH